jgi:hypothetical protein
MDPDAKFMARFEEGIPRFKGVSQCTSDGTRDVRDRASGEKGCVFWTGDISWIGKTEVTVEAGHDMGRSHASDSIYHLAYEDGKWRVGYSITLRGRGSR